MTAINGDKSDKSPRSNPVSSTLRSALALGIDEEAEVPHILEPQEDDYLLVYSGNSSYNYEEDQPEEGRRRSHSESTVTKARQRLARSRENASAQKATDDVRGEARAEAQTRADVANAAGDEKVPVKEGEDEAAVARRQVRERSEAAGNVNSSNMFAQVDNRGSVNGGSALGTRPMKPKRRRRPALVRFYLRFVTCCCPRIVLSARRWVLMVQVLTAIILLSFFDAIVVVTVKLHLAKELDYSADDLYMIDTAPAWLYGVAALIGGHLSALYGYKHVLGIGVLSHAIVTSLLPFCAESVPLMVVTRVLAGVGDGVVLPCAYTMAAKWIPSSERTRAVVFLWSGTFIGTMLGLLWRLAIEDRVPFAWELLYLFIAVMGVLWYAVWLLTACESPADSLVLTRRERRVLADGLIGGHAALRKVPNVVLAHKVASVPWRRILTSAPVWAFAFSHFCYSAGVYVFMETVPAFLKSFNLYPNENLFWAELPLIVQMLSALAMAVLADFAIRRRAHATVVRSFFQITSQLVPTSILIFVSWVALNRLWSILLSVTAFGFLGFALPGFATAVLDATPTSAGPVSAVTIALASVAQIGCPHLMPYVHERFDSWVAPFFTLGVVNLLGVIFWIMCGTSKRVDQNWATGAVIRI